MRAASNAVPGSHHDPKPREKLSLAQARKIALAAQRLACVDGGGVDAMLRALGAVQLDTISVLARSHELVAYARLGAIARAHIENAYWGNRARAFEYYAHGNCILPIEAWPYFAFRRRAWQARPARRVSEKVVRAMRARLQRGPVTASDVGGARAGSGGWWNWSEEKMALEVLYRRGDAVVMSRRGWKRIYDLPERAIPAKHSCDRSDEDCYRFLIARAARALGIGTARDIADYFHTTAGVIGAAPNAKRLFQTVLADSNLVPIRVEGWDAVAYADPDALAAARPMSRRPTLLSPFDSLVWQRERTLRMFEFKFSLEAYKPKHLREHGYFTMPLLADGSLVGRVDPARDDSTLVARTVTIEDPSAVSGMASALRDAAAWVGCDAVKVERVRPRRLAAPLRRALSGLM